MQRDQEQINVQFRYVSIPYGEYEIPAICLCYPTLEMAVKAYEFIHNYSVAKSANKSMTVEFAKGKGDYYTFFMKIVTSEGSSSTAIGGIEPEHVNRIRKALGKVAYYLILAGYQQEGTFELLSPKEYHMFKKNILIDGEEIMGNPELDVDWMQLLG